MLKLIFTVAIFTFFTKILNNKPQIMKKFSCILGLITAVLISSCSNEEFDTTTPDNTDVKVNSNGTLLKKTIAIVDGGTTITTGEYTYTGNKLSRVTTEDKYVTYQYTGDLITSREFYSNNLLASKEIFEYNANKQLVAFKRVKPNNAVTYNAVYAYNSDNTISVTGYKGALKDAASEIRNRKVFVTGGQISKIETYNKVNGATVTETAVYTFDGKHSPFASITGFDKLTYYDAALSAPSNNILSSVYTASNSSKTDNDQYQYTYNSMDYPTTATELVSVGKPTVYQYFYQ